MSTSSARALSKSWLGRKLASVSVLPALLCLLAVAVLYSVTIGRYGLSVRDVAYILIDNVHPLVTPYWDPVQETVVEQVRLPRILAAIVIGYGLSISGAALQGLFRNPLVDPSIIGVTAGAGFGGTLAILMGLQGYVLLAMAFLFGIGSVFLVKLLSTVRGRTSMLTLVLAGVVISAFFSAAISIAKLLADPFQKLPAITYWLMGSIASSNYLDVLLLVVAVAPSAVAIYLLRFQINLLSLGEEKARALGAKVVLVQWIVLVAASLISAGVVATSGIIGWVGLVIPHVARALVGADHQRLLPVSGVLGAIYLLMVDNLARTMTTAEIPLGIITALIGVPVFAVILRRLHAKGGWSGD
jgi:iron complex transport system permease protein